MQRITEVINQINDPATRKALQVVFDTLKADLDVNKTAFDAHTHNHYGNAAEENTSEPSLIMYGILA